MIFKEIEKDEYYELLYNKFNKFEKYRIYHSFEWISFIEKSQNLIPKFIKIVKNDECIGIFPYFEIKVFFLKLFASPFEGWTTGYMGPIIEDIYIEEFFTKFYKYLKKRYLFGQFSLILNSFQIKCAMDAGFIVEDSITYIAPIKGNDEDIIMNFTRSARKSVRRALNKGLIVERTYDKKFIDIYYDQLIQVFRKSNMVPTYSKNRVIQLWDCLFHSGKLIATQVKFEDKIIATRIDYYDGEWLHSFGSASDQQYLNLNPNELARYFVMCEASKLGLRYYDMSGGGAYKAKFGADVVSINRLIFSRFGLNKIKKTIKKLKRKKLRG